MTAPECATSHTETKEAPHRYSQLLLGQSQLTPHTHRRHHITCLQGLPMGWFCEYQSDFIYVIATIHAEMKQISDTYKIHYVFCPHRQSMGCFFCKFQTWYIVFYSSIWVRSWNCGCLVTWFCYQLIAKPGNETAVVSWPDPYPLHLHLLLSCMQHHIVLNYAAMGLDCMM